MCEILVLLITGCYQPYVDEVEEYSKEYRSVILI